MSLTHLWLSYTLSNRLVTIQRGSQKSPHQQSLTPDALTDQREMTVTHTRFFSTVIHHTLGPSKWCRAFIRCGSDHGILYTLKKKNQAVSDTVSQSTIAWFKNCLGVPTIHGWARPSHPSSLTLFTYWLRLWLFVRNTHHFWLVYSLPLFFLLPFHHFHFSSKNGQPHPNKERKTFWSRRC